MITYDRYAHICIFVYMYIYDFVYARICIYMIRLLVISYTYFAVFISCAKLFIKNIVNV